MRFLIPFLGKTRSSWLDAGIHDYAARLRHYAMLELPILKERHDRTAPRERTMQLQAEELCSACPAGAVRLALDPRGRTLSSEELAAFLTRLEGQGRAELVFLIGGHYGLHESLLMRAEHRLSFSPMTFTHEMSRLLLLEQLYRACTIRAGHPYHL